MTNSCQRIHKLISKIVCLKIQLHVTYVQLPMLEFMVFVFVVMRTRVVVSKRTCAVYQAHHFGLWLLCSRVLKFTNFCHKKDSHIPSGSFAFKLNQVAHLIPILLFLLSNSISHSNVQVLFPLRLLLLIFLLLFVLLFREHQVFSTWPEDIIKKVAVESRLRDYNSDEVIVRDSSDLHWIVFIVKVS